MPLSQDRLLVEADAEAVAERVVDRLIEALSAAGRRPLGLATGRTMEPVYAALRRRLEAFEPVVRGRLLAGWSSFNLDDYIGLAADHPASFHAAMDRNLGEPLGLSPAQLRLPDGGAPDPEAEARRYARALAAAGGLGLQLLGLGENGHVGFNEPPAAQVSSPAACA
ncbi:6-phosphogluconolactonase [Cyanobium sp. ATX-6F1]|uniref:6-phosphogluconolactonase n=1 Tax=Cyanobium sp. ATX-6F1 TaxID=3137388 RepID=UPI0039BE07C9